MYLFVHRFELKSENKINTYVLNVQRDDTYLRHQISIKIQSGNAASLLSSQPIEVGEFSYVFYIQSKGIVCKIDFVIRFN